MNRSLDQSARELVTELRSRKFKIVFAESCTGGLVSATLTKIPAVSDCLCGSAVTYLDTMKIDWLGVREDSIRTATAVSELVAREMVEGVLGITKAADFAAAITGHLGPHAPPDMDGVICMAIASRGARVSEMNVCRIQLESTVRRSRQKEAAKCLIDFARRHITPNKEWD